MRGGRGHRRLFSSPPYPAMATAAPALTIEPLVRVGLPGLGYLVVSAKTAPDGTVVSLVALHCYGAGRVSETHRDAEQVGRPAMDALTRAVRPLASDLPRRRRGMEAAVKTTASRRVVAAVRRRGPGVVLRVLLRQATQNALL